MKIMIKIKDGKIERRFTEKWNRSGFINMDKVPQMVESIVSSKNAMMLYIEELHNKIDELIELKK